MDSLPFIIWEIERKLNLVEKNPEKLIPHIEELERISDKIEEILELLDARVS